MAFSVEAMVCVYHVYQSVWTPTVGEELPCRKEPGNIQDPFSVSIVNGTDVVGHVPKKISSMFLQRGGTIVCEITSPSRRYSVDIPQGGLEIPCVLKFDEDEKDVTKIDILIKYARHKNIKVSTDVTVTLDETEPPEKKMKLTDSNSTHSGVGNGPETETISCGGKLDLHINYAQQLLKEQFPNLNGLQSTLFQSKKQARGTVKNQLQVIHSREDHWIVASTVGSKDGVVLVFLIPPLTRKQLK